MAHLSYIHARAYSLGYGTEVTTKAMRKWLEGLKVKTPYIEPSSAGENANNQSFNGKLWYQTN